MFNLTKSLVRKFFKLFGFEIYRHRQAIAQTSRASMYACLRQACQNGLQPKTIIDVGAASGTFALYEVFPEARHILIEPLEEYIPHLNSLVDKLEQAEYIIAAATAKPGNLVINVHPDLVGSSFYKEDEDSDVNGVERTIPGMPLDNICSERGTEGPYLIKIDTQGYELEVLKGAQTVLKDTELVILEVSFFEFFKGGPQVYDCLSFMKNLGFVPYDIFDLQYRLLDGAMSQVDIAFVREQSQLRKYHFYATREQRAELTKQFLS
ncbi:FkbM family methyltransferase [Allocoleopsis franciscana]|uniref:Methyltransferase, FkbM family n=1 Tax=Allocoleopsis franciscana PCC 7113 TaxID=1173027 RepID=K9WNI1_9CYAN|nr:FkbM family methyltransferase [Allocoleopsis franciscana]AFZ21371.1 methyltransferase, FkbM family [Allocoleopsis franciscana PCC 7113]